MGWLIKGDRRRTVLAVSSSGVAICYGEGNHEPIELDEHVGNVNSALLRRLQQSKCGWTIALPTEAGVHIDGGGAGLLGKVQQSPEQMHGMIRFYEQRSYEQREMPDLVGFVIVAPEKTFFSIRRLLELVMLDASLSYTIVVDFLGFRVTEAETETPTWDEFLKGRPYFFEEASVSVGAREDDA